MELSPFFKWSYLPFLYWSYLPFYIGVISLFTLELSPFLHWSYLPFYIGVASIFYIVRLHCNLLIWSCLPLIFCAIALQSIKLELPPFVLFCAIALQS